MKIQQHPRVSGLHIGDEVYSTSRHLIACVSDVFPAAVCVRVLQLQTAREWSIHVLPELWSADEIENLSVCRSCGCRDQLQMLVEADIPYQMCEACATRIHSMGTPPVFGTDSSVSQ